jgi:hypothetical protein
MEVTSYRTPELFRSETSPNIISKIPFGYSAFSLNRDELSEIMKTRNDYIKFSLPHETKTINILLKQVSIITPDFSLLYDRGTYSNAFLGLHYQGVVQGDPNSIVAFSIFNDEITGLIATKNETLEFGKLRNETLHVLGKGGMRVLENWCATRDSIIISKSDVILTTEQTETAKCVRVYIEVAHDIFLNKGGLSGATNYILGLFNQSNAIYSAENITVTLSQIFVWTSPSPFSGNNSTAKLNSFQNYRTSFNGDVAHLVDLASSMGGIAAGFNAFCGNNSEKMCYSGIESYYNNVPTYSWSVMVFTHEMGHLFSSRHTHACVWNGNNTAIDGCAGYTEGGCPLPGNPSNGGTIMSYCHLNVGINFLNGFGLQPGNLIRNRINNATCLNASCCPDNLTISFPVNNPIKYEVNNNITANSLVNPNNGQILFDGGRSVILNPGFSTSTAANFFEAFIDGCGGLRRSVSKTLDSNTMITYKTNSLKKSNNKPYSLLPRIYPNPSNGIIYINIKDISETLVKIEIHDLTGKQMLTINRLFNLNSIDISKFVSGIYIVSIKSGNTEERYKIVKY